MTRRPAVAGAALTLLLSGCAVGQSESPQPGPEPRSDLARAAEIAAKNHAVAARAQQPSDRQAARRRPEGAAAAGSSTVVADARASRHSPGSRSRAGSPEGARVWRSMGEVVDGTEDHGSGPAYADITGLGVRGSADLLSFRVTVAGAVPGRLADREVQGVGIDLHRSGGPESDYQVFLDGGAHGWRAFLQTPEGFVAFPGTVRVTGRTFEAVVPWASVGGREPADVSVFLDWSSGAGGVAGDGTIRSEVRPD